MTTTLVTDAVLRDPLPAANGGSNMISAGAPMLADVQEIARCTALALKRRHELLGPLAAYDPLTAALVALFARRPASGHPCSQAWIDAELGMAYLGTGETAQAVAFLKRERRSAANSIIRSRRWCCSNSGKRPAKPAT